MSRFKPSLLQPPTVALTRLGTPAVVGVAPNGAASTAVPTQIVSAPPAPRVGVVDTIGYVLFCAYVLSGHINEWTLRLLSSKAYLSVVLLLSLPLVLLISSNRFRGLKNKVGLWWVAFILLLFLDTPFSAWKGGTVSMLIDYIPRSYICYFFISAFTLTLSRCRGLMYVNVIASALALLNCFLFGVYSDDGRLRLSNSLFFSNSNELALQLLTGIVQFVFLFREGGIFKKAFSCGAITLSVMYILRTGSRGCLLSALCYGIFVLFFSRNRILIFLIAIVVGAVGIATVPSLALRRITSFSTDVNTSAAGSESQRRELLQRSIVETVKHPLFGVGPGQFAVFIFGEQQKKGEWSAWLGTHNSYTQVSVECGIPALICYCAVILLCFRLNYRVLRATRNNPLMQQAAALSFTLLGSTIVYSVSTFFFHMAYSGALPGLSGMTVALYLAMKPTIEAAQDSKRASAPRQLSYQRS